MIGRGFRGEGDETAPSGASSSASTDTSSAPGETSPAPTADDEAALASVAVAGDLGATPTVAFDGPLSFGATVARVDTPGTGDPVTADDLVEVNYAVFDGESGELSGLDVGHRPFGDHPARRPVRRLQGAHRHAHREPVGTRVVLGLPGGTDANTGETSPSNVMVLETTRVVPVRAAGTPVTPADGLPVVTLADNGEPSIEVPADATKPTDLVVQPLIEGDGKKVAAEDILTVQYSGWLWDGTSFDSSWSRPTPFQTQIGNGSVIDGWDQGLIGQKVGSQVLLVVPPELGYQDKEQGSIPPNSTLIFVVDILSAN